MALVFGNNTEFTKNLNEDELDEYDIGETPYTWQDWILDLNSLFMCWAVFNLDS